MRALHQSVMVKKALRWKTRLLFYWSVSVLSCTMSDRNHWKNKERTESTRSWTATCRQERQSLSWPHGKEINKCHQVNQYCRSWHCLFKKALKLASISCVQSLLFRIRGRKASTLTVDVKAICGKWHCAANGIYVALYLQIIRLFQFGTFIFFVWLYMYVSLNRKWPPEDGDEKNWMVHLCKYYSSK